MNRINVGSAIIAGLVGTAAMTLIAFLWATVGWVKMSVPVMLSGFLGAPLWVGWVLHFAIGAILAVVFALIFAGRATMKMGALYGLAPWILAMLVVMPIVGNPVFGGNINVALASLINHVIFGAIVGLMYRPSIEAVKERQQESASEQTA